MSSREAGPPSPEDLVGQAIRQAGPRPAVPAQAQAALRQAAHAAWQKKVESQAATRRRPQLFRTFALAATLLLGVGLVYLLLQTNSWPLGLLQPSVATVEISSEADYAQGVELKAGTVVDTQGTSRLALRLHTGVSLRLDANTQVELHSDERLTLRRGAIYLDSGPGNTSVAVETPFGIARDIGTQFEVRLLSESLRVAVREGEVRVEQPQGNHQALAGTALTVGPKGRVERTPITSHDEAWSWVLATAPSFELEGSSMWEFLGWVTRETGWHLQTTGMDFERRLKGIKVHGSVEGLRPDEAIEVVLPGAGLEFKVEDGALILDSPR